MQFPEYPARLSKILIQSLCLQCSLSILALNGSGLADKSRRVRMRMRALWGGAGGAILQMSYVPKGIEGHRTAVKQFTNIYSDLAVRRFDEGQLKTFTESSKVKGNVQVSRDVSLDAPKSLGTLGTSGLLVCAVLFQSCKRHFIPRISVFTKGRMNRLSVCSFT